MDYIKIEHLIKTYPSQDSEKQVLSNLHMTVEKGDFFCIMGSSGSGKSTLLRILGGMDAPTAGEITVGEQLMSSFRSEDYDAYRQNTAGLIFQDFQLFQGLTLKENVILPLTLMQMAPEDIEDRYHTLMEYVDIKDFEDNYPPKSSGGQQQRTAICRALIKSPDLLLADEPTGNLDTENAMDVLNALLHINQTFHTTILLVTHDAAAASYCSTVAFMQNGQIQTILKKTDSKLDFYYAITKELSKRGGIL